MPHVVRTRASDTEIVSPSQQRNARAKELFRVLTTRKPRLPSQRQTTRWNIQKNDLSGPPPQPENDHRHDRRSISGSDTVIVESDTEPTAAAVSEAVAVVSEAVAVDPELLRYYSRMQWTAVHISHPAEIRAEALRVAGAILAASTEGAPSPHGTITYWARRLFFAGIARLEYTRTVAVLVHDILASIVWKAWSYHWALDTAIVDLTMRALAICCKEFGLDSEKSQKTRFGTPGDSESEFEKQRMQMLNAATFAGDLFAVGMLSARKMRRIIECFVKDNELRTVTHCQALHLLLLRAQIHVGEDLAPEFLVETRRVLAEKAHARLFVEDRLARRWLIESCNVVERTLTQRAPLTLKACHRWSPTLMLRTLTSTLNGQRPIDYGLLNSL